VHAALQIDELDDEVRFTDAARDDLERLVDSLIERASSGEDLELAQHAIDATRDAGTGHLADTPYSFRKAGIDRVPSLLQRHRR